MPTNRNKKVQIKPNYCQPEVLDITVKFLAFISQTLFALLMANCLAAEDICNINSKKSPLFPFVRKKAERMGGEELAI